MSRAIRALGRLLQSIPDDQRWLRALVLINVAGSLYGFNWYAQQLAATPWPWWPVVPDSPLSSLSFGIYLAFRLARRPTPALAAWAQLATFKYGLWSVIVLGGYLLRHGGGGPGAGELWLLISTHAGVALEAYLLMMADPAPARWQALGFAWLVLNDAVDYTLGTHPRVPDPAALPFVAVEAFALSWLALAVAWRARGGKSSPRAGLSAHRGTRYTGRRKAGGSP